MFRINENTITTLDIEVFKNEVMLLENGASVIFEGIVRNHNEGKNVTSLEYQAYPTMAIKVGNEIIKKAKEKFNITNALCIHRTGHLKVGEIAVWVVATSHHRQDSFLACEYIIDEVKTLVPIWKREHYLLTNPEWVACHQCGNHHGPHHA